MVNLKDIAERLGVSTSTVSRALNGSEQISAEVREKVVATAAQMGYSLRGRGGRPTPEWNTAGIIVPEVMSDYYARIIHMTKDALSAHGYSSIVKITNFSSDEMVEAINSMNRIQVKCLLIVLDHEESLSERIQRTIHNCRIPVMLLTSRHHSNLNLDCIHLDEYTGIIMAVQHLQRRGYSRIGFIGEKMTAGRLMVFKQAMNFQKMRVDPQLISVGRERMEEGGYLRMKELMALPEPPDAVFCSYDQMAIGAIHALREGGKRVPEDVAIVGFDDIPVARYVAGGITTIANPCKDMVAIAVSVLLKRVSNPQAACQQISLRPNIVLRSTT